MSKFHGHKKNQFLDNSEFCNKTPERETVFQRESYWFRRVKKYIGVLYKTKYDQDVAVQILQHVIKEPIGVTCTPTKPQENKSPTADLPKYAKYVIRLDKEEVIKPKAQMTFSFGSISSSDLLLLAEVAENLTKAVESHWSDFSEDSREKFRELLSNPVSSDQNLISALKTKALLFWIKLKCSQESIDALMNASNCLRKAIAKAVKLENSAEAKAIERIASIDESTEWDILVDKEENINIEDVKTRLQKRGYNIKTHLPGEESSKN
jgi:hypothetical protein